MINELSLNSGLLSAYDPHLLVSGSYDFDAVKKKTNRSSLYKSFSENYSSQLDITSPNDEFDFKKNSKSNRMISPSAINSSHTDIHTKSAFVYGSISNTVPKRYTSSSEVNCEQASNSNNNHVATGTYELSETIYPVSTFRSAELLESKSDLTFKHKINMVHIDSEISSNLMYSNTNISADFIAAPLALRTWVNINEIVVTGTYGKYLRNDDSVSINQQQLTSVLNTTNI